MEKLKKKKDNVWTLKIFIYQLYLSPRIRHFSGKER